MRRSSRAVALTIADVTGEGGTDRLAGGAGADRLEGVSQAGLEEDEGRVRDVVWIRLDPNIDVAQLVSQPGRKLVRLLPGQNIHLDVTPEPVYPPALGA